MSQPDFLYELFEDYMDDPAKCIGCGACMDACKHGARAVSYTHLCRKSLESQTGLVLCQMDILPELLILRKQIRKSY